MKWLINSLANTWDKITDNFEGFMAILVLMLGVGLAFGIMVFIAWIIMLVYNGLAAAFCWPTFSLWFWVGVIVILRWIRGALTQKKEGD